MAAGQAVLYRSAVLLTRNHQDAEDLLQTALARLAARWHTLVRLVGEGVRVKATGFGRFDFPAELALRRLYDANPHALVFGTDLPCPRAFRSFHDGDYRLVGEVLGESAARLVVHDNAVDFYRPATARASG